MNKKKTTPKQTETTSTKTAKLSMYEMYTVSGMQIYVLYIK
jgi:hypothetical protein